ncbi:MAG: hypothetical protein HYV14_05940 [Elusimicrobia bacterium]|nr:hypothetical protein [Elusimicrobiota bacterium]
MDGQGDAGADDRWLKDKREKSRIYLAMKEGPMSIFYMFAIAAAFLFFRGHGR